jgi:hypothetical protein
MRIIIKEGYAEDDLIESLPNLIEVTGLKNPLPVESDSLKRVGLKIDGYLRKDYLKRLPNLEVIEIEGDLTNEEIESLIRPGLHVTVKRWTHETVDYSKIKSP